MRMFLMLAAAAGLVLAGAPGCGRRAADANARADAVTAATYKMTGEVVLPPTGVGEYTVVGKVEGLNNFVVRYDENVYRGGQPLSAKGMDRLAEWGVKKIISVTPDDILRKYAREQGLELVEVPFDKGGVPAETLETFLAAIRAGGPVYVHCMGGTHRAGTLCAAYRVRQCGWDYDDALIEYGRLGGDLKGDHAMIESIKP